MSRQQTIKFLRTSRANLDAQAGSSGLLVGEPYLVTDETPNKLCLGISTSAYVEIGPVTASGGSKITDLSALTGANLATGDLLTLVDISDTSMHATGTNKSITVGELISGLQALGSLPKKAVGSTQITNSTTTPANVDGIAFSVVSGRTYKLEIIGQYQTSATTTGINFSFSGPAVSIASWNARVRQAANGTDSFWEAGIADSLTSASSASVVAANTDYPFFITGMFRFSADGTLQLRFASEVASSNAIVQIGTIGLLTDLG